MEFLLSTQRRGSARSLVAIKPVLALALAFAGPLSHASTAIVARVTATGVYGNGDVYVMLDAVIPESACPVPRFDIPAISPATKGVLATAQIALATGKSITIATSGCFGPFPTLDISRGSFFYLNSN
jgi:hypothetical protein